MVLLTTTAASAQALPPSLLAVEKFTGTAHWDGLGMRVMFLDDFNGDGVPEFASSAFCTDFNGVNSGSMYVFDGSTKGILRRHDGANARARFGDAAAVCGDVDNDGVMDYVIGASRDMNGPFSSGSATVFSGATGVQLHYFQGAFDGELFGSAVCAAGDVDADGHADLLVGSPGEAAGTGRARIYSGATGALVRIHSGTGLRMNAGRSVKGVGDVDGDGYGDYAVGYGGTNGQVGEVEICSGYDGLPIHHWIGSVPDGHFGSVIEPAGDVDADGVDDVLVGESCGDRVHVYSGQSGALIRTHVGNHPTGKKGFGHAMAPLGDWNGDGFDDYVLGAPGEWNTSFRLLTPWGEVHLIDGASGNPIDVIVCPSPYMSFGSSLSGGTDLDGDGNLDLLIGIPAFGNNAPGSAPGAMVIGYGAP